MRAIPDTNHYSAARVPTHVEASDLPSALGNFRTDIGPQLVLHATSASNRDAKYGAVPPGTIVSSAEANAVWMKTATGWTTIHSDTGWIELSQAVYQPRWTHNGSKYRVLNDRFVELYWSATYNGVQQTNIGPAFNIDDEKVMTIPAEIRPNMAQKDWFNTTSHSYNGTFVVFNTGSVTCTHLYFTDWWATNAFEGRTSWMLGS